MSVKATHRQLETVEALFAERRARELNKLGAAKQQLVDALQLSRPAAPTPFKSTSSIPLHEPLNLHCNACAGRARVCTQCGGVVHRIHADNSDTCSLCGRRELYGREAIA